MKRILLLGDSIRMSYWRRVAELLKGQATVTAPEENCRFSANTLFYLRTWLGEEDFDIIQWNNGQWDTARLADGQPHTPLDHYVHNTTRIGNLLKPRAGRLFFATTTPVHDTMLETGRVNPRTNEDIQAYNAAACQALDPLGVNITDLNTPLAEDIHRYISDDQVHLTPDGVERCARIVAERLMA